jgi:hypothetical protein
LPLHHKSTTTILSYKLIVAHLLRLTLKLVVCAEGVQIQLSAIGLVGPATLTQSKEAVRGKAVNLDIKLLQHFTKKLNGGEAKAARKVVLKDNNVVLAGRRDNLACGSLARPWGMQPSFLS